MQIFCNKIDANWHTMPNQLLIEEKPWSRRHLLKLGLAGAGVTGAAIALQALKQHSEPVRVPPNPETDGTGVNPMAVLRDFDYGTVKQEKGRTIREFRIVAGTSTIALNSAVSFNTWNFNDRVPGPTLRAKQGDRVRVLFLNQGDILTRCIFTASTLRQWMAFAQCATVQQLFMSLMPNHLVSIFTTATLIQ